MPRLNRVMSLLACAALAAAPLPAHAAGPALLSAAELKATSEYKELLGFAVLPADTASSTITMTTISGSARLTRSGGRGAPVRLALVSGLPDDLILEGFFTGVKASGCTRGISTSFPDTLEGDAAATWKCNEGDDLTFGAAVTRLLNLLEVTVLPGGLVDVLAKEDPKAKFSIEKTAGSIVLVRNATDPAAETARYTRTTTGFTLVLSGTDGEPPASVTVASPATDRVIAWSSLRRAPAKATARATTKTKTVTCVKGKKVRKVTGKNARCPRGYRTR